MRISVVIPLYNKAPHVERAIRSALEQTTTPAEVIVVNDRSTDGGDAIVRGMASDLIKLFDRTEPGPGGYAARNLGISEATGEWIAFLDADDQWRPDHLQSLTHAIAVGGGRPGVAFSLYARVNGDTSSVDQSVAKVLAADRILSAEDVLSAWIAMKKCPLWTGAVMIRRDVLLQAGLFPAGRANRGGDKDLWLRSIMLAESVFSKNPSAEFHLDTVNRVSNSAAHTKLPIITETIAAMMESASPSLRPLLGRLSNLEIAQYAKHAAGSGSTVGFSFLKRMYLRYSITPLCAVIIFMLISRVIWARDTLLRGKRREQN